MFETRYPLTDHQRGLTGFLRIAGGIWSGDACVFEFCETVRGLAGSITCDWRNECANVEILEGDATTPEAAQLSAQLRHLMRPFQRGAFHGISDQELRELYNGDYHKRMNLAINDVHE